MSCITALRQDALTETYEDLQMLIYKVTQKIAFRYKLSFDELIGPATEIFVREYDRFDSRKGCAMSSWIYSKLNWGLISYLRTEYRHHINAPLDELPEQSTSDSHFIMEFKDELSRRAARVVDKILDTESELHALCRINDVDTAKQMKETLREHLEDLGWSDERIERIFKEIKGAFDRNDPKPLRQLRMSRNEVWLLSRVGLTPSEVRSLVSL